MRNWYEVLSSTIDRITDEVEMRGYTGILDYCHRPYIISEFLRRNLLFIYSVDIFQYIYFIS